MPADLPTHYKRMFEPDSTPSFVEPGDEHVSASLINGLISEINGFITAYAGLFLSPEGGRHRKREAPPAKLTEDDDTPRADEYEERSAAREVRMGEEVSGRAMILSTLAKLDTLPGRPEELPTDKEIANRIRAARQTSVAYVMGALADDARQPGVVPAHVTPGVVPNLGALSADYVLIGYWMEMHGRARTDQPGVITVTARLELPGPTA